MKNNNKRPSLVLKLLYLSILYMWSLPDAELLNSSTWLHKDACDSSSSRARINFSLLDLEESLIF